MKIVSVSDTGPCPPPRFEATASQDCLELANSDATIVLIPSADNQTKSAAPSTAWEGKLKDLIWSLDDNQPRFRHEKWRAVFDEQLRSTPLTITAFANPLFSLPLGEHEEKWTVWLSKEAVWDRFNTLSQIAVLEGEEREVSVAFSLTSSRVAWSHCPGLRGHCHQQSLEQRLSL